MPAWLCSSISSGCGQPFSTASRKRCSEPTPGLPPHEKISPVAQPGADQLVVHHVGRHPHERQVAPALADDLVAGGVRDEVGEALERDRVAVVDELGHGLAQGVIDLAPSLLVIAGTTAGSARRR